jgi:hypothetical protein
LTEGEPAPKFTRARSDTYDNGVLYLAYRPVH